MWKYIETLLEGTIAHPYFFRKFGWKLFLYWNNSKNSVSVLLTLRTSTLQLQDNIMIACNFKLSRYQEQDFDCSDIIKQQKQIYIEKNCQKMKTLLHVSSCFIKLPHIVCSKWISNKRLM